MDAEPTQTLARKTALSAISSVANTVGNFIVMVVIARRLGPEGSGQVAYLVWLSMTMAMLTNLGLPGALTRFVAEYSGRHDDRMVEALVPWLARASLAFIFVGTLAIGLYGHFWPGTVHRTAIWITLAVVFLVQGLGNLYMAMLTGRQQFRETAWINLVSSAVQVLVVFVGCRYYGILGGLASYVATMAIPAVLCGRLFTGRAEAAIPPNLRSRVWRYSLNGWAASVVSAFVWTRMEIYFLQRFSGSSAVAMFTVGLTLANLVSQVPQYLLGALLPHFSELVGRGDKEMLRSTYASATRLMALILFPLCLCGAAAVPVLMPMVFGRQYMAAIPTASVLVGLGVVGFAGVGSALQYACERAAYIAICGVVGAVVFVIGCIIVVPRWGYYGAAWLRVGMQTMMIASGVVYITFIIHCPFPLRDMARLFMCGVCSAAVMHFGIRIWGSPIALLPWSVLSTFVFAVVVRVTRAVPPEDLAMLESVTRRCPLPVRRLVSPLWSWLGGRHADNVCVQ